MEIASIDISTSFNVRATGVSVELSLVFGTRNV